MFDTIIYKRNKSSIKDTLRGFLPIVLVFIFIGAIVALWSFYSVILNNDQLKTNSEFLNTEINALEKENAKLLQQIEQRQLEIERLQGQIEDLESQFNLKIETIIQRFSGAFLEFEATAYTAGFESTGKTPDHPAYGITFSGEPVKEWHTIAADPDVLPIGTKVFIPIFADKPNGGIFVVEDTGRRDGSMTPHGTYRHIQGRRIDIYHPDLDWAQDFGRRPLKIIRLDTLERLLRGSNNA